MNRTIEIPVCHAGSRQGKVQSDISTPLTGSLKDPKVHIHVNLFFRRLLFSADYISKIFNVFLVLYVLHCVEAP